MKYLWSALIFSVITAQVALAQSDTSEFNIRIFGGADNEAPTTPVLNTATPITSTQIDIAWSAATDNYSVSGYSVLRDGVPIATTTLLTYSDTGLLASTTYSYVVRAFDPSFNYSSTSNSLSTTTPDTPVVPVDDDEEEGGSQGTGARVIITDWRVATGYSTTSIFLTTSRPSRFELRWGKTESYELGYVVTNAYATNHAIHLTDLEPGNIYYYEIVGYAQSGFESIVRTGNFTTLNQTIILPANVNRFTAVRNNIDVNLSWELPLNTDVEKVRIVRSYFDFPSNTNDGALVYEGLATGVRDSGILAQYSPVYYTAFVYDKFGNVSSGAVTLVYAAALDDSDYETGTSSLPEIITPPVLVDEATSTIDIDRVTPEMKMPNQNEVFVIQGDNRYTFLDTSLRLDSQKDFIISVPKNAVSGNLKSIIFSIIDPTDNRKVYAFLLKINKEQTAYETTIAPFGIVGRSNIVLRIYDYEAFLVASYQTSVNLVAPETAVTEKVIFPDLIYQFLSYLILFILILLLIILLYTRRVEDKE